MKVLLLYRDRDFGANAEGPPNAADLTQDLELEVLLGAMAAADDFLLDVARKVLFASLCDSAAILYRQQILEDCLARPDVIRNVYAIAVEAVERERKVWGWMSSRDSPRSALYRAVEVLQIFVGLLKRLRKIARDIAVDFRSEGFGRFFEMLAAELGDEYLLLVEDHLRRLEFRDGVLMTAQLGAANKGTNYILRKRPSMRRSWTEKIQDWVDQLTGRDGAEFVYEIADRDEGGFRALSELRDRGIAHVAAALAQSTDHILAFFQTLRWELGFYIGCMNLQGRLERTTAPVCFPKPLPEEDLGFSARGLYDVCLRLNVGGNVVGNDVTTEGKTLVMITGANRGGKSTFLRSVGLAQVMMQCGMFVPAEALRANICDGIFTHFKREEDATMKSGKLDEELSRMNAIVAQVKPNSLVLFNESFASTNEREGSEIARQIVRALLESGVKVFYVTHLYDLARGFYRANMDAALFLRAERLPSGQRTFRIVAGEPLRTSYGEDLYQRIFNSVDDHEEVTPPHD